jgi:hypothetical protein
VVVVLAGAPQIMLRLRVPEFVRALKHPRDGVAGRAIQRDLTLARLVLAVPDVEHALTCGALDVPHLLQVNVLAADVLHLDARIDVFAARTAAQ